MALTLADLFPMALLQRPLAGPAFGSLLPKSQSNVTAGSPPAPTPPPQSSDAAFLAAMTQAGLAGPQNELHRAQAEQAKSLAGLLRAAQEPAPSMWETGAGSAPGPMPSSVALPPQDPPLSLPVQPRPLGGGMATSMGPLGGGERPHINYGGTGALGDPRNAGWETSNLTVVSSPSGAKFKVHNAAAPDFGGFLKELEDSGYSIRPDVSGGHNLRKMRGEKNQLSEHSYGTAIDINSDTNLYTRDGRKVTDLPPSVAALADKYNLDWGGNWKDPIDTMHFQWRGPRSAAAPAQASEGALSASVPAAANLGGSAFGSMSGPPIQLAQAGPPTGIPNARAGQRVGLPPNQRYNSRGEPISEDLFRNLGNGDRGPNIPPEVLRSFAQANAGAAAPPTAFGSLAGPPVPSARTIPATPPLAPGELAARLRAMSPEELQAMHDRNTASIGPPHLLGPREYYPQSGRAPVQLGQAAPPSAPAPQQMAPAFGSLSPGMPKVSQQYLDWAMKQDRINKALGRSNPVVVDEVLKTLPGMPGSIEYAGAKAGAEALGKVGPAYMMPDANATLQAQIAKAREDAAARAKWLTPEASPENRAAIAGATEAAQNPALAQRAQTQADIAVDQAKATPTADMKEYEAYVKDTQARGQAPMSLNAWDLQRRRSSATMINTAEGFDVAQAKARFTMDTAAAKDIAEQAVAGRRLMPLIDEVVRLADKTPGGWAGPVAATTAKALSGMGFPVPEGLSNAELLQSISQRLVPIVREPGPTSEKELNIYLRATPGLMQSQEGRVKVAEMTKAIINRTNEIAKVYRNNVGAPDLYDKLAALDKPIFTDDQRKALEGAAATPSGAAQPAPAVGSINQGYRFKGGNPADPKSWEKVR